MPTSPQLLASVTRLNLAHPPVAVAFLADPPAGLKRIDRPLPAGCSYWKRASEGDAFYTMPADHENCAVGAFTHGVTLSPAKAKELEGLIGTMVQLQYLRSEEVAGIPHRGSPMQIVAYAPLAQASFDPEVVIFRGNARQIMLVSEAARAAGIFESAAAMGRPACAVIPQAATSASGVASVGCIGNRVYTELGDDEMYFAVPGKALPRVLEQLDVMITANAALEMFHRERATALGA
jgi:uncharacterized protein (DUF169 family)